jgi:hypothetical protein
MAKVYGLHEFELHPGVDEEAFARFFHQEIKPIIDEPNWNLVLLKGDRGERCGKYALLFEVASVEARDANNPEPDVMSEESRRWYEENKETADRLIAKWATYTSFDFGGKPYTDYVEVK